MDTQEQIPSTSTQAATPTPQPRAIPDQTKPVSVLWPLSTQPVTQTNKKGSSMKKGQPVVLGILVVLLGIGSGYGLAVMRNGEASGGLKNEPGLKREVTTNEITVGTKVGVADEKTFKDSAEGLLEKGGIDGEGSHNIKRPGGDSQTVYITSSIIDLDQFIGRKVKIWGETMAAEKAGWFMDVGKLEVLE